MLSRDNTINLEDFRVRDGQRVSKVFTGRDRGKDVREKSKIDELESRFDTVNIVIPNNIYSINPSFFEEFLVNVVKKLGKDIFLEKFNFTSEGDYQYSDPLNQAIDRILKNKTALD
ncbi:DUF4325 domain-containing protein [Parabacteroides sp. OttesenSCG-928-J18]|nr:DUF4325 domain-containing protein [Parabacteroides sp. OttesenSCG-928-J18]